MQDIAPSILAYEQTMTRITPRMPVSSQVFAMRSPRILLLINEAQYLRLLAFEEMSIREDEIKERTPDTCVWLLEDAAYRAWNIDRGLLRITGKPGSGKSTILKFAINESKRAPLQPTNNTVIASFFFSARGTTLQRTALGLFRALLYQLLDQKEELLHDFTSTIKKRVTVETYTDVNWTWNENELRVRLRSFILEILDTTPLILFVDALDECEKDSRDNIRQYLEDICYESKAKRNVLGVCISCRPHPNVIEKSDYTIRVDENNIGDIERCIRYRFQSTHMRHGNKVSLEENITSKASGVFQWVDLVLPRIIKMHKEGKSIKSMLNEIAETPQELDILYTQTMKDIEDGDVPSTWRLLRWICFAIRPLSMDELRFAIVLDAKLPYTSIREYEATGDVCEDADQMERRMTALSKGLVEVKVQGNRRVAQFIHQSVSDFMQRSGLNELHRRLSYTSNGAVNMIGYAHFDLSRSCIKYLLMEEVLELGKSVQYCRKDASRFSFLEYATLNWLLHAKESQKRDLPQEDLLEFFQWPSNDIMSFWSKIHQEVEEGESSRPEYGTTLLHVAAENDFISVLRKILNQESTLGKHHP